MTEGRAAEGAPRFVPWEMSDEEIKQIGGPLAEELKRTKQRYFDSQSEQAGKEEKRTIDNYVVQLKKAGFETGSIHSLEDAFNFTLNQVGELNNIVDSLKALTDEKEKAEQEKQILEQEYMQKLETEVKNHFRIILQTQDEEEKKNTLQTFRDLVLGPLESKFFGEGYTVTENKNSSFGISFESIEAAQWFNWKFHDVRGMLYNDMMVRYQELQVEIQVLRDKLRDKGLGSSSFEADQNRARKELLEKVSKVDELASMPQEKLVKEYMEIIDQLMLSESQASVFEELWPEIKEKSGSEKWIYIADSTRKLHEAEKDSRRILEKQQERYSTLEKSLNSYIQKNIKWTAAIKYINDKIASFSRNTLETLAGIADYFRENNVVCDFGYTESKERKPLDYLKAVSSGIRKFDEIIRRIIEERNALKEDNLGLKTENKALQQFAREAVDGAKNLKQKLDEFKATPEETEQRNALLKKVHQIQYYFIRYMETAGVREGYPGLRQEIMNVSFENVISDHYLGILDDATALVKNEFSGLEDLVRAKQEKEKLVKKYNCSFDELKSKIIGFKEKISGLQAKEEKFASGFEDYRNTRNIKPKTIATVHANWTNYMQAEELGHKDEQEKILNKIYSEIPEDPEAERTKAEGLFGEYEDILGEKLGLVESVRELEPEFDPNFNKKKQKVEKEYSNFRRQEDELRGYLGRSKTVEKASDLIYRLYKQILGGVYHTVQSRPYEKMHENFTLLTDVGNLLDKEINSPGDLLVVLKEEKKIFNNYIKAYRREKAKVLERLK